MYSNTKGWATACIVISGFNIIMGILLYLYISTLDIPYGAYFGATFYIVTTSAIFLILSIMLRKLSDVLELEFLDNVNKIKELRDHIKKLETDDKS